MPAREANVELQTFNLNKGLGRIIKDSRNCGRRLIT